MSAYVLSPDALQDLQDIWDFVAFDNVMAANQLEDAFFAAFEKLTGRVPRASPQPSLPIFFITNPLCTPSQTSTAPCATIMICVPASQEALNTDPLQSLFENNN